jgi:hypothetical protein
MVNSTTLSLYPCDTDPVAVLQEGVLAASTAWKNAENQQGFEPGFSRSKLALYRLSYHDPTPVACVVYMLRASGHDKISKNISSMSPYLINRQLT